jgi:O-antigen/teichoic acid export membrane protein
MKLSLRLNAIFKILLSILNILIPLLLGPYVIRVLSRSSYDAYTKASVEIQLFLTLATAAVHTYGIRKISRLRGQRDELCRHFSELFFLGLIFNLLFTGLYYIYITSIGNHRGEVIYFILMIQFLGSSLAVEWMNEALEDFRFITIKSLVVKVLYIAAIFILLRSDYLLLYGLIISLSFVLENLLSFLYITRRSSIKLRELKLWRHLKGVFLAFLIANISLLYVQADKIMLGLLLSDSAVAAYTIPNYIVTSIYSVVISLFMVAIPRMNALFGKSKGDYEALFNELSSAFLMIFIPLLIFVFISAEDLIIVYAAGKYNDCILPLKLFTIAIFFNALVFIQREGILYIFEKEKIIILFNLLGGVLNLLANFVFYYLGMFNPATAIITLSGSFLLVCLLMQYYIKSRIREKVRLFSRSILSYFLFSLPAIGINYLLQMTGLSRLLRLFLSLGLFVIVYLSCLLLVKDRVLLTNLRISYQKIRAYFAHKKRISSGQ